MQDINQDNLEQLIEEATDPDLLKELMVYAVRFERDDMVEKIVDKVIQATQLLNRLQDTAIPPKVISFWDSDED